MDIKRLERLVAKFVISTTYKICSVLPIKNKITLATFRTTNLSGNFKFIYNEVTSRNSSLSFDYMFKKFKPTLIGKADYLLHMVYAGYKMATSKYFIVDDYYFPVYVIEPRKGTKILQVWHACGAFKKFGFDVLGKEYGSSEEYLKDIQIHKNYDAVIVSAGEVTRHYASAFDMDIDRIYATGIPRTDIFFWDNEIDDAKTIVYSRFPELRNKKVVLYAPTFRGKGQTDVGFDMTVDLDRVSENLDEGTIFALKMHPFVKTRLEKKYDNIIDLSDYEDVNHLMMVADMLVTDYSSVIFEFSLMEKPIVMYAPDKESYIKERDFYYEYDSFVPGPITYSTEEMIEYINKKDSNTQQVISFKKRFLDGCDGNSTKRFVDKFLV